ncbi:hypothetical protein ACJRO7_020313, partial [Eucalyptus globulus]
LLSDTGRPDLCCTPHALHSVFGLSGPAHHCGVFSNALASFGLRLARSGWGSPRQPRALVPRSAARERSLSTQVQLLSQ